ncbi:hypothetical protein [Bradyrhizobium sp. AUGA SZCCT0283]|uniref:hypothetical protein n=1 Tax=Bradyrhizobium sp. AUGA SZCCT0283 TaxID=2807671 RepID=UPI001BA98246|nr:hypothetical protein [Bradyrhizobium sp. AUGA SZCCT0283]MBR1279054.1 hypothetical protein [Bradyrhizobium sp. AUGA SZCCT0283]
MKRIGLDRSAMTPHGRHANTTGTDAFVGEGADRHAVPGPKFGALISVETAFCRAGKLTCDKASPERAVMLHLRARYVSKAAILTIPAPRVPVENRSPA